MAKKLTSKKARQILHDKSVHGHPLTDKQRRFFGAIAGGAPIKAENGGYLNSYQNGGKNKQKSACGPNQVMINGKCVDKDSDAVRWLFMSGGANIYKKFNEKTKQWEDIKPGEKADAIVSATSPEIIMHSSRDKDTQKYYDELQKEQEKLKDLPANDEDEKALRDLYYNNMLKFMHKHGAPNVTSLTPEELKKGPAGRAYFESPGLTGSNPRMYIRKPDWLNTETFRNSDYIAELAHYKGWLDRGSFGFTGDRMSDHFLTLKRMITHDEDQREAYDAVQYTTPGTEEYKAHGPGGRQEQLISDLDKSFDLIFYPYWEGKKQLDEIGYYNKSTKKNGGWLDSYQDGGGVESRQAGYTDIPFNYNSAWGGQFQNGGELTPEQLASLNRAKMRSKMALAAEFGNPSARRMMNPTPPSYKFTGNEMINGENVVGFGENQVRLPATGTHFMGSMGEYAVPFIQEGPNKSLQFNPNASPMDREAIRFDNPQDAEYFAEHYKEVAPMMQNFAMGGSIGGTLPGSTGFTYARIGAPSNGPYAKKTKPSAENGMTFYQHGLDWKPKTISRNGGWLDKYDDGGKKKKKPTTNTTIENAVSTAPASSFAGQTYAPSGTYSGTSNRKMTQKEYEKEQKDKRDAKIKAEKERKQKKAQTKSAREFSEGKSDVFTLPTGETKHRNDMDWREKAYVSGLALQDRGKINENEDTWYDFLNPLAAVTSMAGALGQAPYVARETNSNLPYVTSIGMPLVAGALGFDPLGGAMKVPGKIAQSMESGLLSKTIKPAYKFLQKQSVYSSLPEDAIVQLKGISGGNPFLHNKKRVLLSDFEDAINYHLSEGLGIKKRPSNLKVKVRPGNKYPGQDIVETEPKFTVDLYQDGKHSGYVGLDKLNTADYSIPGKTGTIYTKVADYPYAFSSAGADAFKGSGISGELNKAITNALQEHDLGNLYSSRIHTKEGLERWLNLVRKGKANQVASNRFELYKKGGVIKDDMGQWAHPGEITEIGSNRITMQGVPYPVLGISDQGDVQMMQPEGEYKFKGKKVTEFPMAQDGIKKKKKSETLPPIYTDDPRKVQAYTDTTHAYNKFAKAYDLYKTLIGEPLETHKNIQNIDVLKESEKKQKYNKKKYKNLQYYKNASIPDYWKKGKPGLDAFNKLIKTTNVLPYGEVMSLGVEGVPGVLPVWKEAVQPYILKEKPYQKKELVTPFDFQRPSAITPTNMDLTLRPVNIPQLQMPGTFGPYKVDYFDQSEPGGVQGGWHTASFKTQDEADRYMDLRYKSGKLYGPSMTRRVERKNGGTVTKKVSGKSKGSWLDQYK